MAIGAEGLSLSLSLSLSDSLSDSGSDSVIQRYGYLGSVRDQKAVAASAPNSATKLLPARRGVAGREQVGGDGGALHGLHAGVELKVPAPGSTSER